MSQVVPTTHDPAFWSAIAGIASAFASAVSLLITRSSVRESRRSADLAEAAARDEIKPLLTLHFAPQATGDVLIEIKNDGKGTAHNIHFAAVPDPQEWTSQYFKTLYRFSGSPLAVNDGQPLSPSKKCFMKYNFQQYSFSHYYFGYTDVRNNPHLCRFMVVGNRKQGGPSLTTIGYGEWDFRREEGFSLLLRYFAWLANKLIKMPALHWPWYK